MATDSPDANSARSKQRRWLVLLLAAHLVASVPLFAYRHELAGLSLCIGQATLLGLWFGFGRTRSPRRLLACALMLAPIFFVLAFGAYGGRPSRLKSVLAAELAVLIFAAFAAVGLASLIMRRTGLEIGLESELPTDRPPGRLQFTIVDLFVFTTVTAIVVAVVSAVRNAVAPGFEFDLILVLTLADVGALLPVLFVTLSRSRFVWRLLAAPTILFIATPFYFSTGDWFLPILVPAQAAVSILSLLVLRRLGYRIYVRSRAG